MRSGHNFFLATGAAVSGGGAAKQWWLSIDNDRCFTSNAVALAAETPPEKQLRVTRWTKEVFDDCAAVKAVSMVIWRLRHNADTIMEQFPLELEQDELAPLLLAFMRTAFAPPTAYAPSPIPPFMPRTHATLLLALDRSRARSPAAIDSAASQDCARDSRAVLTHASTSTPPFSPRRHNYAALRQRRRRALEQCQKQQIMRRLQTTSTQRFCLS